MKSERFQSLMADVEALYAAHRETIDALPTVSPRGGVNGRTIPGWVPSPCSAVSKAVRKLGLPYMKWWSGSAPTPSIAVPACIARELEAAYNRRYAK